MREKPFLNMSQAPHSLAAPARLRLARPPPARLASPRKNYGPIASLSVRSPPPSSCAGATNEEAVPTQIAMTCSALML
jgi:hypothetical protein